MKIRYGITSGECFENKWFYMKYIGKYLSAEIRLTGECILLIQIQVNTECIAILWVQERRRVN